MQYASPTHIVSASYTRPNDTNAYTAGDAVSDNTSAGSATYLTFSGAAAHVGLGGLIVGARLVDSANKATKGQFELHILNAPPTTQADNVAFALTDAEAATVQAVLTFTTAVVTNSAADASGNCRFEAEMTYLPKGFLCASGRKDLYGLLVVRNAYTPVANEQFTVALELGQG